jgi:anti-sigma regulatory factor (Ser/Thr protein kinase)
MSERTTRRFAARMPEVPALCEFAELEASARGLGKDQAERLRLAVEEAAVNVCSYAYPGAAGELEASVWAEGGLIHVELAAWGIPFDPLSAEEPDVARYLREGRSGGFGIKLIRGFADGVSHRRHQGQNVLTLSFSLEG